RGGRAPARGARRGRGGAGRRGGAGGGAGTSGAGASVVRAGARRRVRSGAPPIAAQGAAGAPAWLIASLPHGNAYGHRARNASAQTHQPATASGQARRPSSRRRPTASTAKITPSPAASASHAD